MAREQHIGGSDHWFIGEDKTLPFEIYDSTEEQIQNVTGYAIGFYLRKILEGDPLVFSKTTGASTITITGSYNADPDTNTQRINVLITDDDTDNLQPGQYQYSLWRTDSGSETVLAYGTVELKKCAKPA